jgi:hypothetical protein
MKYDRKKTEIVREAKILLSSKDKQSLSLNSLLKELNIPKGKFYHYFTSKDDFIYQVLLSDKVNTSVVYASVKGTMSFYDCYMHVIDVVFSNLLEIEHDEFIIYLRNQFSDFTITGDYSRVMEDQDLNTFKQIILDGIEAGEFQSSVPLDLFFQLIVNNSVGLLHIWAYTNKGLDLIQAIKDTSSSLLDMYLKK